MTPSHAAGIGPFGQKLIQKLNVEAIVGWDDMLGLQFGKSRCRILLIVFEFDRMIPVTKTIIRFVADPLCSPLTEDYQMMLHFPDGATHEKGDSSGL